jgi:iron(III) transport system substrate-binding protein
MRGQFGDPTRQVHRRGFLRLVGLGSLGVLLAACAAPPAAAPPAKPAQAPAAGAAAPAKAAWEAEWERVLAQARQEGTVAVAGPPGTEYRTALAAFEQAHPDIKLEFNGASGRDFEPKLLAERQAGQYLLDVHVGGTSTALSMKPHGVFAPIRPALLLPEVVDDAKWLWGFDWGFMDTDRQLMYGFEANLRPAIHVNRDFVPQSELSTVEQLLEPRWRGKISWNDPRVNGAGSGTAAHLVMVRGEDFWTRLLQQEVVATRDLRQQAEWLVRGTYPIAGGVDTTFLVPFVREGVGRNVTPLAQNTEAGGRLEVGFGTVYLMDRAPHPNAARVYLNWLLSRDGQVAWSTATARNSRRLDVAPSPDAAPDPSKSYLTTNAEAAVDFQLRAQELAREVLK